MRTKETKKAVQRRELRNRRATRIARQKETGKANRRFPYSADTLLAELVRPEHHHRLRDMLSTLKPYLVNGENVRRKPYLQFNIEKLEGQRIVIYNAIAVFLYGDKDKRVLKVSLSAFARYLTDPLHSNFSIHYKSLLVKIKESSKLLNLT